MYQILIHFQYKNVPVPVVFGVPNENAEDVTAGVPKVDDVVLLPKKPVIIFASEIYVYISHQFTKLIYIKHILLAIQMFLSRRCLILNVFKIRF